MTEALAAKSLAAHPMWLYVEIAGPDECWPFFGADNVGGYGRVYHAGKLVMAHRLSHCLAEGIELAEFNHTGLLVRHRCDNPPCCNPLHLLAGTWADNAADKAERGRVNALRGSAVHNAILTEESVRMIKRRLKARHLRREIASDFGVSLSAIDQIKAGRNWAWVQE